MSDAVIEGIGRTPCGVQPGGPIALQARAATLAIDDAGIEAGAIDAVLSMPSRTLGNRSNLTLLMGALGMSPRIQTSVESGGVSAIAQLDYARLLIASGQASRVLCVSGQDFLSGAPKEEIRRMMSVQGSFHPAEEMPYKPRISAMYALAARRWYEVDQSSSAAPDEDGLARIAAQVRSNGVTNPQAKHRAVVSTEDVLSSRVINPPLRLLECASLADGAAAFIVTDARVADGVAVRGIGFASGANFMVETSWEQRGTVAVAASVAMAECGASLDEVDVWELYDSFSVAVAMQIEGLGRCPVGDAGRMAASVGLSAQGGMPVCTHGGLLANGQPGIAGGTFNIIEAVLQLRGERSTGQVPGATTALVAGGSGVLAQYAVGVLGV
jgi:acetyl-CoA acetyltransferase